jgi:Aromatic-ring-opening dioxygenase LigAB, LigA subunit
MSLYQVQKLLFNIHNDLRARNDYAAAPDAVLAGYKLTEQEAAALRDKDMRALYRMGVNPWLLLQYANISGVPQPDYLRQIREA